METKPISVQHHPLVSKHTSQIPNKGIYLSIHTELLNDSLYSKFLGAILGETK